MPVILANFQRPRTYPPGIDRRKNPRIILRMSKNNAQSQNQNNTFKSIVFILMICIPFLLFGYLLFKVKNLSANTKPGAQNPSLTTTAAREVKDGVQYLNLVAKGGYWPKTLNATANMETVLNVQTKNTFDCSSSLYIPELKISKFLEPTGITAINIPPQKAGEVINGTCSMGMYSFQIIFE